MAKHRTEEYQAQQVERFLHQSPELSHLRVRRHGSLLILESGPTDDPIRHARFRRDTVHLWLLEMATHTGRWEKTSYRDELMTLVDLVVTTFPWTLAAIE